MRGDLSLARLSWHRQLAVFALLALGATAAFWYSVDRPGHARIEAAEVELSELQQRTAASSGGLSRLAELRQQVSTLQAAGDGPAIAKPNERSAADLLRTLDEEATAAGLFVTAFRPKPGRARDGAPDSSIALELEGTYHDLAAFLDGVASLSPPIVSDGLSLRAKQPPAADGTIDVVCTVRTGALALHGVAASGVRPANDAIAYGDAHELAGRRDPFVSPIAHESVTPAVQVSAPPRPEGMAGVAVEEVVVKGVVRSRDSWIALIGLPGGRTHSIQSGDRLMDGRVLTVTRGAIVFVQDADPAAGRPATREVRKELRPETK